MSESLKVTDDASPKESPSYPFIPVDINGKKYRTGLHLSNSMNGGTKMEFIPKGDSRVINWYACGPTVYDAAHMGHARNYVSFDVVRRIMETYFGYDIRMCMNVTDIDDKIIQRSNEAGIPFRELASKWELEFWKDMKDLNCLMPNIITRVSEYLDEIITYIQKIIENGYAYESEGSVYFDIVAFQSNKNHFYSRMDPSRAVDIEGILEGEGALGAEVSSHKRNGCDFALWKKAKPDEPSWESPWGKGRPGWHIECSAMASDVFGKKIDIHSGGIDLKFPHHTNELAQSEAHYDEPQWVNYFLHAGHLHIQGCKMSKSLKNFIIIKDCISSHPARVWRMMFALNRWGAPMDYVPTGESVQEALAVDKKFCNFFSNVKAALRGSCEPTIDSLGKTQKWDARDKSLEEFILKTQDKVHAALCDNVNTIEAIAALQHLMSEVNSYLAHHAATEENLIKSGLVSKAAEYIYFILRCHGFCSGDDRLMAYGQDEGAAAGGTEAIAPLMDLLVDFRSNIRANAIKQLKTKEIADTKTLSKDILATCDDVRDTKLTAVGIQVEDKPTGSVWKEI